MFPRGTHASGYSQITSPKNPLLKEIRRAVERGSLTEDGFCIAETFHLLEEALHSGCELSCVVASDSAYDSVEAMIRRAESRVELVRVPDAVLASVSATQTTQGVVTLVRPPAHDPASLFSGNPLIVVLDGIQDPGNAGAVIRAAEAFGAAGAFLLKGTVSPWNPKTVRSSAGSVFRFPLITGAEEADVLSELHKHQVRAYAAMPRAGLAVRHVDLTGKCAVIAGSEGRGVSAGLAAAATHVHIPTTKVESLNAAVATAVILYEASRQRGAFL